MSGAPAPTLSDPADYIPKFGPVYQSLIAKTLPSHLFHYTSVAGLMGIFDSSKLWATNIHFLNDQAELVDAIRQCLSGLTDAANSLTGDDKKIVEVFRNQLSPAASANVFVCSFSGKPDVLSQWRGYCPVEGGYCIGLETASLKTTLSPDFNLLPCVYDRMEQKRILDELIQAVVSQLIRCRTDHPGLSANQIVQALSIPFLKHILEVAPVIKHFKFEEEQEWRAISTPLNFGHTAIKFRTQWGILKPYIEASINVKHSSTIVFIGPHSHRD